MVAGGVVQHGDQVADPERGIGVQDLSGRRRGERPGEHLPRGTAGGHELAGQVRVEFRERAHVTVAKGPLDRRVEGGGALVEVAGSLRVAAGGAVPHDQQSGSRRAARERGAETGAFARRRVLRDGLQQARPGVAGVVEQHRAEPESQGQVRARTVGGQVVLTRQRLPGQPAPTDHPAGPEGGQVEPAAGIPGRGRRAAGHDGHRVRTVREQPRDGVRARLRQVRQHGRAPSQLSREQGRRRAYHGARDHGGLLYRTDGRASPAPAFSPRRAGGELGRRLHPLGTSEGF